MLIQNFQQETDSDKNYTQSVEDYGNRDVTFKFLPSMEIVFGKFLQYLISPDGGKRYNNRKLGCS